MRKLALLFLSLFLFACGGENRSNLLHLNGRIEGDQYFVSTKYAGKVVEVFVKEGDSVKKGQPLARLDSKELDAQLKGAEAAYRAILCDRHNEPWGIYTKEPPGGSIKELRTVASVIFDPASGEAWMSRGNAGGMAGGSAMTHLTLERCEEAA